MKSFTTLGVVPALTDHLAKTGIKETFYVCKASQGAGQC